VAVRRVYYDVLFLLPGRWAGREAKTTGNIPIGCCLVPAGFWSKRVLDAPRGESRGLIFIRLTRLYSLVPRGIRHLKKAASKDEVEEINISF
jgi:hypothetical protein